jgi:hypothetical protein
LRFSTGHFSEKHLAPLRKSFVPSRRQRRQTGPVKRAIAFFLLDSVVDRFTRWQRFIAIRFDDG